jgi:putative adenylate-forming enzyme
MQPRVTNLLALLRAFIRTRWGFRFSSRQALLDWQRRQLAKFLKHQIVGAEFYRPYAGQPLENLPVVSKRDMLGEFSRFNRWGITLDDALAIGLQAERDRNFKPTLGNGITVGLSSGTSGERGVFLVSDRERSVWAGVILARVLSTDSLRQLLNPFAHPLRVAFFLRANSNLYTSVQGGRLHFRYCDLTVPLEEHLRALDNLKPDLLIAPGSVLRALAEAQAHGRLRIAPTQVINVAEVLEPDDQQVIEATWRIRVAQVYQCTEGFLAYTCERGRLHLNEEFVHVEREWLDPEHTRFTPIITDFTRHSQIFARHRLDDVLSIASEPCPCGRMSQPLAAVEGRQDDVLWLPHDATGELLPVFPDLLRRSMMLAQTHFTDYQLEQVGMELTLRMATADGNHDAEGRVRTELGLLWKQTEVLEPALRIEPWRAASDSGKRRRIRCIARPAKGEPNQFAAEAGKEFA